MSNELFPKVKKSINDLIDDEEGNIPRSKLVVIGSTRVCQEKCVSNLNITKK